MARPELNVHESRGRFDSGHHVAGGEAILHFFLLSFMPGDFPLIFNRKTKDTGTLGTSRGRTLTVFLELVYFTRKKGLF